jgi:hypothetical protein
MILIWRGRGIVALLGLFLPLGSCAGLLDWSPLVAFVVGGLTLFAGGVACRHFGRKWNQGSGIHTLYFLPMEWWGWVYMIVGAFFFLVSVAGLIRKAWIG